MVGPALLRAIHDQPDDDAVRLVYADWLDEHREPEQAEFIRVQCELEPIRNRYENERAAYLHSRESELWNLRKPMDAELEAILGHKISYWGLTFRRGFADTVTLPVQWYLEHGDQIHETFPLLRRVELYRVAGWGERLAQYRIPQSVQELEIPCWIWGADAEAIATSDRLRHLSRLHVWLGNREDFTADAAVCRALAACAAWPRLTELRVTAVDSDPDEFHPAFNELVREFRRPGPVFVNPWRRPFAFAPGGYFDGVFPGRLPNGEQTFFVSPPGRPWCLVMLRFDPDGNPLGQQEIDIPDAYVSKGYRGWDAERELIARRAGFLRDTLGHRPGFIRLKELQFEGHWWVHNYPWHFEEEMGYPDPPEQRPENDDLHGSSGMGGSLHDWISTGSFVFTGNGGDWWVDGSGHVTST
jgi:uncharacterized protein (TIGR02996 family)